jgi:hypothetical protein
MKKIFMICAACMLLLTWSCENKNYEIDIPYFSARPSAITSGPEEGTYQFTITTELAWTAAVDSTWLTLSDSVGTGNQTITVTLSTNRRLADTRSALITVTADGMTRKVRVWQDHMTLGEGEVAINGVIWATRNVGNPGEFTDDPADEGLLYQFNRKVGYPSTGVAEAPAITPPANWPATPYVNDQTDWLPENDPCPAGWRVPTEAELTSMWQNGIFYKDPWQSGFARAGLIAGISPEAGAAAIAEDMRGAIFIPYNGWRTDTGEGDRHWGICAISCRTQDVTLAGRVVAHADWAGFNCWTCTLPKSYAAPVRCVRDL